MNIQAAVDRLNSLLPLKARQEQLPAALKKLHQQILRTLVLQGRSPTHEALASVLGDQSIEEALQRLGSEDLVVLDAKGQYPLGAYPVTLENTAHKISVNGHTIHAMCALDAVSVGPMFNADVVIESQCHVSQTPIILHMQGDSILHVQPSAEVMIGIRWQTPSAVAAHSLCMEMIFLQDRKTAEQWQNGDTKNIDVFTLADAIAFGKEFFLPLLK